MGCRRWLPVLVAAGVLTSCKERPRPVKTVDVIMPLDLDRDTEPAPIHECLRCWGEHRERAPWFYERVTLPMLDDLRPTKAGPPYREGQGGEEWLSVVTVHIPPNGPPSAAGFQRASRWRGIAVPRYEGPFPPRRAKGQTPIVTTCISEAGEIQFGASACKHLADLRRVADELLARAPSALLTADFNRGAPYRPGRDRRRDAGEHVAAELLWTSGRPGGGGGAAAERYAEGAGRSPGALVTS